MTKSASQKRASRARTAEIAAVKRLLTDTLGTGGSSNKSTKKKGRSRRPNSPAGIPGVSIDATSGSQASGMFDRPERISALEGQMSKMVVSDTLYTQTADKFDRGGPLSYRGQTMVWRTLGASDDGRKWALSALHPCGDDLAPPVGIPDHTQQNIATPSYRNTSSISRPDAVTTPTWDTQIVTLPIPEIDYIWRARSGAGSAWGNWQVVRPSTFPQNPDGTMSATTMASGGYKQYRYQGRGITVHHLGAANSNQGVVYYGQVDAISQSNTGRPMELGTANDNTPLQQQTQGGELPQLYEFQIPDTPDKLIQMDSLSGEWNAKFGVYMVNRFRNPVHEYVTCNGANVVTLQNATASETYYAPSSAFTVVTGDGIGGADVPTNITLSPPLTQNLPPKGSLVTGKFAFGCSDPGNLMAGIIFMSGIAADATLSVKSRMHIEATVASYGASIMPFVHSSPVLDTSALNIVAAVGQVQKHGYYASYNSLGSILGSIFGAVKSVAPTLLNAASGGAFGSKAQETAGAMRAMCQ
jgi:hypothetical protein